MAGEDKFENELISQPSINVETDYIRTIDSLGISYKTDFSDVAEAIIEAYRGSTLDGSARTVKQAFDAHGASLSSINETLVSIEDRICTYDELAALEERLGL